MADFEIVGGRLFCNRDPRFDDPIFKTACEELLKQPGPALALDMSKVKMISSPEIGLVIGMWKRAKAQGKTLSVTVSKTVYTVLRIIQLENIIPIEVAGA